MALDRRQFLSSVLAGCSAAASPLLTPVSLASAPWDQRLVVIILRGALDGIDAIRPVGDPDFEGYRRVILKRDRGEAPDLDGYFALHPALAGLMPLWRSGEFAAVQATSTPYRDKRSHFDGQAVLEAGGGNDVFDQPADGWLNRLMTVAPGVEAETAFAVGRSQMQILAGDAPHSVWRPRTALRISPQAEKLLELVYHDDPLFRDAALTAADIIGTLREEADEDDPAMADAGMAMQGMEGASGFSGEVTRFVVERLLQETRIASFSINGWDTHAGQGQALENRLGQLADTILLMRAGLGDVWRKTAVLVMTEFGRTARANGNEGTDHGTGGAMFMAGGAIRGGKIYGDWPGLAEASLYNRRDLMPTRDIRAYAGWAMRGMFGTGSSDIERIIFPGLDLGDDPGILL